jgi:hypothetical protein
MKRTIFAIVLLIASVVWGQTQINPDSLKILEQGKSVTLPIIREENNWGVNPLTFAHPKMILGDEFKKALDSYLFDLLKEYKADCEKEIYKYEDAIFKKQNGISMKEYYADSKLNGMGYQLNQIQFGYWKSLKPTFEGFIEWLERRVK